jgi:hypothetical protein
VCKEFENETHNGQCYKNCEFLEEVAHECGEIIYDTNVR